MVGQAMGQRIGSTKQPAEPTDNPPTSTLLPQGCSRPVPALRSLPCQSSEFTLHGIDYLPEFEKRRERRRRKLKVPRFLRIDTSLWSSSYLRFLGRVGRISPGPESSDDHDAEDQNNISKKTNLGVGRPFDDVCDLSVPVETPDCTSEIVSDEWLAYPAYPFENLVLSGGGSKGYAYVGALKALEDCGVLKRVKRIAGSSAGAICAALLAVGCSPQDIADVFKCDIKWLFHDQSCECCCCLPRVCNKYGVHPARRFYRIYGEHIARKTGDPDITFKEVLDKCGIELCIVVTNLSRMCSEYCCPTNTPNLPIREAVRMSMSFPVVFRAVRANISGRECLYADGGILDQYPISWFDGSKFELNHNIQQTESSAGSPVMEVVNWKTIGLYLVSEKAMDYKIWQTLFGKEIPFKPTYLPNTKLARARLKQELSNRKRENKQFSKSEYMEELKANNAVELWDHYQVANRSHVDITNFGEYFITAIETLLVSQRKMHVKPNDVARTIAINCGYIGTNDYVIEPGDREFMIRQGFECTRRYLLQFVATRPCELNCMRDCEMVVPCVGNSITTGFDDPKPIVLKFDSHADRLPDTRHAGELPCSCSSSDDVRKQSGAGVDHRCGSEKCSSQVKLAVDSNCLADDRENDGLCASSLDASHSSIWLREAASANGGILNGTCRLVSQHELNGCLVETQV